jgi:hypothetical protein
MNSILVLVIIFFVLILIFLAIDHYIHKRWLEKTVDSINQIFDGLKTFFFVTLVDRFSSALDESENPEDKEDDATDI